MNRSTIFRSDVSKFRPLTCPCSWIVSWQNNPQNLHRVFVTLLRGLTLLFSASHNVQGCLGGFQRYTCCPAFYNVFACADAICQRTRKGLSLNNVDTKRNCRRLVHNKQPSEYFIRFGKLSHCSRERKILTYMSFFKKNRVQICLKAIVLNAIDFVILKKYELATIQRTYCN